VESVWPVGTRTLIGGGVVADRASTPEAGGRPLQGDQGSTGWRIGGTSEIAPGLRLHASASQRGRFPALRELYSGALNRFDPNPDLVPERLLVTEAGLTFGDTEAVRGWSLQATAFRQRLQDGIVRIAVADRKFRRVNQNDQESLGLEGMVGWRGGLDKPSLLLDFVAQRVRIEEVGSSAGPTEPEHQPNVRAGIDGLLPLGRGVVAGTNIRHIGSQYCVHPDLGDNVTLSAQTAAGLTVEKQWSVPGWKAFRFLRVLGALDNVTDAAMYEQCGLPRPGRTFRLSISLH
jgi:iron complex outermembrane receptor protein